MDIPSGFFLQKFFFHLGFIRNSARNMRHTLNNNPGNFESDLTYPAKRYHVFSLIWQKITLSEQIMVWNSCSHGHMRHLVALFLVQKCSVRVKDSSNIQFARVEWPDLNYPAKDITSFLSSGKKSLSEKSKTR